MVKMVKCSQRDNILSKRVRTVQRTSGKAWRRAAAAVPLKHPKKPVGAAWPVKDLRAFDFAEDMGWGNVMRDVLKSRGWGRVKAPCHAADRSNKKEDVTVMWIGEFESMLRRKDPKDCFGKRGAVQDGYRLKKIPLPKRALWLQNCSDYAVPGEGTRALSRECCSRLFAKHRKNLPGNPGDFRICGFPGVYNALAKTNFSEYFRDAPWYPRAYILPREQDVLLNRFKNAPHEYWITKPRNECSGAGIVAMKADDPALAKNVRECKGAGIVQRYLADPVLLGGYKFHMRIHMVVTSLSPPEAYVQAGGQCLFCTKPYSLSPNTLGAHFDPPVHISNTGLNMKDRYKDYFLEKKPVIGAGQQVYVAQLEAYLAEHYPRFKREDFWSQIMQISKEVVEYMACAPGIVRNGKFGPTDIFDIFGMDLMIDNNLKVWMCETNNSPGLDDQDKTVFGKTNPDYKKEHKCFVQLWNDIFTLLGLDASVRQTTGTLRNWYQVNFTGGAA